MPVLTVSKLGDAKNVKLRLWGMVYYLGPAAVPGTVEFDQDVDEVVLPLPTVVEMGKKITVGFDARLEYQYESQLIPLPRPPIPVPKVLPIPDPRDPVDWVNKSTKNSLIDVQAYRWDLTRTVDGITIGGGRVGGGYESNYVMFEGLANQENSSATENAHIDMQAKLSPAGDNGSAFSFSMGPIGFTPPKDNSATQIVYSHLKRLTFADFRPPKPPIPPPKPIDLPRDMLIHDIHYENENQSDLSATELRSLNQWLRDLENRPDCRELWSVLTNGTGKLITLTGYASNTGRTEKIDDDISFTRAENVQKIIVQKIGKNQAVANAVVPSGKGRTSRTDGRKEAPRGVPDKEQRFVRVEIIEANARLAIAQMRQAPR